MVNLAMEGIAPHSLEAWVRINCRENKQVGTPTQTTADETQSGSVTVHSGSFQARRTFSQIHKTGTASNEVSGMHTGQARPYSHTNHHDQHSTSQGVVGAIDGIQCIDVKPNLNDKSSLIEVVVEPNCAIRINRNVTSTSQAQVLAKQVETMENTGHRQHSTPVTIHPGMSAFRVGTKKNTTKEAKGGSHSKGKKPRVRGSKGNRVAQEQRREARKQFKCTSLSEDHVLQALQPSIFDNQISVDARPGNVTLRLPAMTDDTRSRSVPTVRHDGSA